MPEQHTIKVIEGTGDLTDVHAVRREVFIVEQEIPEAEEWDDRDASCTHLLAVTPDGAPLGTARLLPDGHLGRLAVLKQARGTGLGAALVRAVEAEARRRGMTRLALDAQVYAIPFYERLGYAAHGGEFDDGSGIMHRAMTRSLA
ncbi:GNAT family N-acetyltransferase [Mangrovactinospora gilvigrisea]|uniref:GNAT family N-acetyltransferase n=1 Tax=Mangrovactinospora gilvigrisea TaxID=1428644 RepID=A0A1J7CA27_9ACTN|nr:GNAT family N-acetyltransferase [Mangrovactinospora gilvigrisea]OIV38372.1 GNAT family N-acetyltransferase [Mangrovactinospora gilvigrisea]